MHHVPGPGGARQTHACAEDCPTGATKFGERDELVAEAQEADSRQSRTSTCNHIYGLEEVGGTSVLLLSAVPLELRIPHRNRQDPLPMLHLPSAVADSRFVPLWRNAAGRHVVDHPSPRRSGCRREGKTEKKNGGER